MPIYEYRCSACGHKLESLQRLSDPPLTICPACGKEALAKQLSAAGFHLKGSGWYATDFKNSGSKPKATDSTKPDAKADATAGATTEAKSDSPGSAKADAPAAPSAAKTGGQGKSETHSTTDKPAPAGTTSGSS